MYMKFQPSTRIVQTFHSRKEAVDNVGEADFSDFSPRASYCTSTAPTGLIKERL